MSVAGEFDNFAPAFPRSLVPEVIAFMLAQWPQTLRPAGNPLENRITNRFAGRLQQAMRQIEEPHFRFTCRPKLPSPNADSETGELDIEVTSHSPHPDAFLVVECKRLNVETESGFQSRAGDYVGPEGMGCFISDQYSSGGDEGIMLGYVMTRTIPDAIDSINTQLKENHVTLRLALPHELVESDILDHPDVKETNHNLDTGRKLRLAHVFVEFTLPQ